MGGVNGEWYVYVVHMFIFVQCVCTMGTCVVCIMWVGCVCVCSRGNAYLWCMVHVSGSMRFRHQ